MAEAEDGEEGDEGVDFAVMVIRSVTICGAGRDRLGAIRGIRYGTEGETEAVLTRLSKVFRLPTKMVSPSMKYEYSVWVMVRMTYLSEGRPVSDAVAEARTEMEAVRKRSVRVR